MILQSKQHDYYDSILHKYRDNKIVFKREEKVFEVAPFKYLGLGDKSIVDRDLCNLFARYVRNLEQSLGYVAIGESYYQSINALLFCGKVFPFFEKKIRVVPGDKIVRDFHKPHQALDEDRVWLPDDFVLIHESYAGEGYNDPLADKICHKYSPIILLSSRRKVTLNPLLKDLKFPMHAHDAAQSLLQFLAPIEPDMATIDDKYKVQAHGFDQESFRRAPGGPTRKRKPKKVALQPMQITLPNKKAFRLPKEK